MVRTFEIEIYMPDHEYKVEIDISSKDIGVDEFVDENTVIQIAYEEGIVTEEIFDYIECVTEISREGHFDIINKYK